YTPLKHAHKMKSLIPRSELIVVSDGTHAVLRQKSSQAAQIVDDFLQK
ncbi:MAG: alpha/beta hydrolase, partial [Parcubacteria group bacterium]|nr:alpha/beta hydrolase [Parcubacteria group bacterium]